MRATLTILGLYNYDTSIFENLTVPAGVDAATAINSICMDNAELEIMYPEPETMKFLIGLWSTRMLPIWERVLAAITAEYNPLENYNRTENWSDTEEEDTTNSQTGNNTRTPNLTETRTPNVTDTRTPNITTSHKVAGYNSSTLVDATQEVESGTDTVKTSGTDTVKTTGTDSVSTTESGSGSKDRTLTHSGTVSGNIGVTTNQQMLLAELGVAEKVDIYQYISESFRQRFCLMVY